VKRTIALLLCLGLVGVASSTASAAVKNAGAGVSKAAVASAAAEMDSVAALEKAVAKDSTNFDNLYRLGVAYLDRDRPQEAQAILTRARDLRPRDHRVLVNLGVAMDAAGHAKQAQDTYRSALAVAPDDSVAICRLANSLHSDQKDGEAMQLLTQLIQKAPTAYCAYFTMGVAFADAGLYRDAIRMWRRVVELAPASPEAASAKESIDVLEKFIATP
jgi:protein O-GlcNAc transferase